MASVSRLVVAVLARFGAVVGLCQAYALPVRWNRGPESRWWERLRRRASALLGTVVDERAGPRPITPGEYAGRFDRSLAAAERFLYAEGFVRNPLSRLKTRGGQAERGSWVYRESPLARRQLHVMLFPDGAGVDVYAHEELSSVNPLASADHLNGTTQNVATGVERARDRLPLETTGAPVDPPEGPWDSRPTGSTYLGGSV